MASVSITLGASGRACMNIQAASDLDHPRAKSAALPAKQPARDPRYYREPEPEMSLYRPATMALLRRYMAMSAQAGRLPSVLGQEFFRSRASGCRAKSFEDVVILVHDVDRAIAELDVFSQQLIARVVLQEYSFHEAARLLRCSRVTVARELPTALDRLSGILLQRQLLELR